MTIQTKAEPKTTITVKQAVVHAMAAAKDFYAGETLVDLLLDEVEMTEDGKHWLITLSFFRPSKKPATELSEVFRQIQGRVYEKKYKQFRVDALSGRVTAMKIRDV